MRSRVAASRFTRRTRSLGGLVLESVARSELPADWTPEALVAFDPAFTPDMAQFLRPAEGIETREIAGGHGTARSRLGDRRS